MSTKKGPTLSQQFAELQDGHGNLKKRMVDLEATFREGRFVYFDEAGTDEGVRLISLFTRRIDASYDTSAEGEAPLFHREDVFVKEAYSVRTEKHSFDLFRQMLLIMVTIIFTLIALYAINPSFFDHPFEHHPKPDKAKSAWLGLDQAADSGPWVDRFSLTPVPIVGYHTGLATLQFDGPVAVGHNACMSDLVSGLAHDNGHDPCFSFLGEVTALTEGKYQAVVDGGEAWPSNATAETWSAEDLKNYLKSKYASVEDVNKAWRTDFHSWGDVEARIAMNRAKAKVIDDSAPVVQVTVDEKCWVSLAAADAAAGQTTLSQLLKAGESLPGGGTQTANGRLFRGARLKAPIEVRTGCPGKSHIFVSDSEFVGRNESKTPEKSEVVIIP